MLPRLFSFAPAVAACGLGALLVTSACGGDDEETADAGPPRSARLVIQPPPGDIVGLPFNDSVTLRVLYETDAGEPIPDGRVQFSILATGADEDPGGSTLSANQAITDAQGIARVDLHAGAERTHFRIEVDAADAPTTRFYVAVSETGFARLIVTPVHEGWREPETFERIELRLYRAAELRCVGMDIDDLPQPVFPPRTLAEFGGSATYQNVTSGEAYTLVAWTLVADSATPISVGCTDLGAEQVPPGNIELPLVLRDRALVLPEVTTLSSTLDLAPLAAAVTSTGVDRPWRVLACPTGPGQLLLDCTLDVLAPDTALDCVVHSDDPIVAEVEALRGAADANGCRPAQVGSDPSLDQVLLDGVAEGAAWPIGPDLDTLLQSREDTMISVELTSQLTIDSPSSARHRLGSVRLEVNGTPFDLDLSATDRPVLQQSQVPIDFASPPVLDVGEHGFTLRYGSLARAAFVAIGLSPRGLGERASHLGAALVESVSDGGASDPGCPSVSAILCGAIESPLDCALEACSIAALHLDTELEAWWTQLNGSGLDFELTGQAPIYDHDDDLLVDDIGRSDDSTVTGEWSARFELASGQKVSTSGAFGSVTEAPPDGEPSDQNL